MTHLKPNPRVLTSQLANATHHPVLGELEKSAQNPCSICGSLLKSCHKFILLGNLFPFPLLLFHHSLHFPSHPLSFLLAALFPERASRLSGQQTTLRNHRRSSYQPECGMWSQYEITCNPAPKWIILMCYGIKLLAIREWPSSGENLNYWK